MMNMGRRRVEGLGWVVLPRRRLPHLLPKTMRMAHSAALVLLLLPLL